MNDSWGTVGIKGVQTGAITAIPSSSLPPSSIAALGRTVMP